MTFVVYSTHRLHARAEAAIERLAEIRFASALDARTLALEAEPADIVVVRAPIPESLFDGARRLRAAIRHGAGVDMIPLDAATRSGVLVANVPGANARSVAEYAIFAALALARRFRDIDADLRLRGWSEARAHAEAATEIAGRTIGIVGFGAVGRAVATIAADGFGMRVLAATRRPGALPGGVEARSLEDLMADSDIVVLCCPLTEETRGMVGHSRLSRMKPHGVLVNVSRGAVVDEAALVAALSKGQIGGAALDVFEAQPLGPDHPLLQLRNVILTPHLAGITEPSMERMGMGVAAEIERILSGALPANFVNPAAEAAYRRRFPSPANRRI
jgi:D-3-phosphoglycerate dehydrogenase / 2-oxoglutarate reductase